MKMLLTVLALLLGISGGVSAQYQLKSPNERISVNIDITKGIHYSISINGVLFLKNSNIDLIFNNKSLGQNAVLKRQFIVNESNVVVPVVAFKESKMENNFNQLNLVFKNKFTVEFRAFNDGVAYRFVTKRKGVVEINETADFEFGKNFKMWASPIDEFVGSYEVCYEEVPLDSCLSKKNAFLPILIGHPQGYKMLLTEVNVSDYPNMFLTKAKGDVLSAIFPAFPLEVKIVNDRKSKITKTAGYIAKTSGKRSFPWRLMVITEKDAELVESNLVYLLSEENTIGNTDWIKPGRVSWEWWNHSNLYGVDFKTGFNTATYKYYVDFASKNGLEYILLDEGWSVSTTDISKSNPDLDLQELIRYGKEKGVKLILWASWVAVKNQFYIFETFKDWGIAGIKMDYMNRADQLMVNFYEKVACEAARFKLLVDFHGAFKPSGLHRAYPNVLAYEGVLGLEFNKWSKKVTPKHNLTIPFIRMVCGPMDYTPGAMRNFKIREYRPNRTRPGSLGTRCHQIALFIVFESGLQMLADSPSNYEREKESTDFIVSIPNTWDEIKVIEAKVGEYLVLARRKGSTWFIGALNNGTAREISINLSFLAVGDKQAVIMQDGVNADKVAEDYMRGEKNVNNQSKLNIKLVAGGGFAARIK